MTNPQDLHKKQTEYIRVKETGEVYETSYVSNYDIKYVKEGLIRAIKTDEIQFCTPLGFKDGKAEVVEDPTDYDGEMICIGDDLNGVQVYGFMPAGEIGNYTWVISVEDVHGGRFTVYPDEMEYHTPLTEKNPDKCVCGQEWVDEECPVHQPEEKVSDCCGADMEEVTEQTLDRTDGYYNYSERDYDICKSCGEPCEAVEDTKPDPIEPINKTIVTPNGTVTNYKEVPENVELARKQGEIIEVINYLLKHE